MRPERSLAAPFGPYEPPSCAGDDLAAELDAIVGTTAQQNERLFVAHLFAVAREASRPSVPTHSQALESHP